jgi:ribose 5-phosphate isomerase B
MARGDCDHGVFFCWTGTDISIAANKVSGIRAALRADPGQAAGARVWNHANVLCLSNRTLADDLAKEILTAWFATEPDGRGMKQGATRFVSKSARRPGAVARTDGGEQA